MNKSELVVENEIRKLISEKVIPLCYDNSVAIEMMEKKTVSDIVIFRNTPVPRMFLIEVKSYKSTNGRIGFGGKGEGIQPEILIKRPKYLEEHMRWVFCQENDDFYYVLTNDECCEYIAGDRIGLDKQNNFRLSLFKNIKPLSESEFIEYVFEWLRCS